MGHGTSTLKCGSGHALYLQRWYPLAASPALSALAAAPSLAVNHGDVSEEQVCRL